MQQRSQAQNATVKSSDNTLKNVQLCISKALATVNKNANSSTGNSSGNNDDDDAANHIHRNNATQLTNRNIYNNENITNVENKLR